MKHASLRLPTSTSALRLLGLALVLSLLTGCLGDDVPPIYEIPEDDYVVVYPASEPGVNSWTSTIGHRVSEAATRRLETYGEFLTVPYGEVIELMYAEPLKKDKDGDEDEGPADDELGLDDPATYAAITAADVVWMRGGDQWQYVSLWNDTLTEDAIQGRLFDGNGQPLGAEPT